MMVNFILENFDTTKEKVFSCMLKSNIVVFKNNMVLMADDKFIYYFGSNIPKTKEFYNFYQENRHHLLGKRLYSKDIEGYKNHCSVIYKGLYLWVG
jgi:hypothetical protein